jgi:hypothetical protein
VHTEALLAGPAGWLVCGAELPPTEGRRQAVPQIPPSRTSMRASFVVALVVLAASLPSALGKKEEKDPKDCEGEWPVPLPLPLPVSELWCSVPSFVMRNVLRSLRPRVAGAAPDAWRAATRGGGAV